MSDDKRKNPWGNVEHMNRGDRKSGGNNKGGGRGRQDPPDIDDMLRKAQQNLKNMTGGRDFKGGGLVGLILVVILVLWFASGFYVVSPGESAVIQRFGAWDRTQVETGLGYHFPAPIETANVLKVSEIKNLTIGFDAYNTRQGAVRRDVPEESLMLTSDRNIIDLDVVVQWDIKSAEDYLFNIEDQENTIKKVAESAIREVVGQTRMFPIITTGRKAVADKTKDIIQENLDEYKSGVNITQVLIEKAEVHPDVQGAFQDVQSAKQDAEDAQNRSEAYREDILPKAQGTAIQTIQQAEAYQQSVVARAKGDAERFNAVYQAYLTGKDVTKERIFLETMENVFKNASTIVMDNGKSGTGVVPYLPLKELNNSTIKRTE